MYTGNVDGMRLFAYFPGLMCFTNFGLVTADNMDVWRSGVLGQAFGARQYRHVIVSSQASYSLLLHSYHVVYLVRVKDSLLRK